jgi:glutamate racemase
LRTIQQNDLEKITAGNRVLGVIRPTAERIGEFTKTGQVGVLGTAGTIQSESYLIEIQKFFPQIVVYQEACPMWVPLVENREYDSPGADYFVQKHLNNLLSRSKNIDTILLACTHYPLLKGKIEQYLPAHMTILSQGKIVAQSLENYLRRHPQMEVRCSREGTIKFFTTDLAEDFNNNATLFYEDTVSAVHIDL